MAAYLKSYRWIENTYVIMFVLFVYTELPEQLNKAISRQKSSLLQWRLKTKMGTREQSQ